MSYLVFDIETSSLPFEEFDETQQEYLLRYAKDDEEREEKKRMMSLNPLTAEVVAIGMVFAPSLDAKPTGCVYSNSAGGESHEMQLPDGTKWCMMPEREMLVKFWDGLRKRRSDGGFHLISFNGRNFDCPFLMLRSAVHRVKPSRNLMDGTRWKYDRHVDLQEELRFKSTDRTGATRACNFDFYCKAFGIPSPKGEGITGHDVPERFRQGEHQQIAEYCMRDVWSTWELFKFWREYMTAFDC
ncbi:MAG: ribonuclease H-like domain-containing protein [Bacteroidota bacterium]